MTIQQRHLTGGDHAGGGRALARTGQLPWPGWSVRSRRASPAPVGWA